MVSFANLKFLGKTADTKLNKQNNENAQTCYGARHLDDTRNELIAKRSENKTQKQNQHTTHHVDFCGIVLFVLLLETEARDFRFAACFLVRAQPSNGSRCTLHRHRLHRGVFVHQSSPSPLSPTTTSKRTFGGMINGLCVTSNVLPIQS